MHRYVEVVVRSIVIVCDEHAGKKEEQKKPPQASAQHLFCFLLRERLAHWLTRPIVTADRRNKRSRAIEFGDATLRRKRCVPVPSPSMASRAHSDPNRSIDRSVGRLDWLTGRSIDRLMGTIDVSVDRSGFDSSFIQQPIHPSLPHTGRAPARTRIYARPGRGRRPPVRHHRTRSRRRSSSSSGRRTLGPPLPFSRRVRRRAAPCWDGGGCYHHNPAASHAAAPHYTTRRLCQWR